MTAPPRRGSSPTATRARSSRSPTGRGRRGASSDARGTSNCAGSEDDPIPDEVEIGGTWIGAEHQRSALNTEAKLLMLTHAFETWNVWRVAIATDERNERSRTAIARLGATFEGDPAQPPRFVGRRRGRHAAEHRHVLDHRGRMAGRQAAPRRSARPRPPDRGCAASLRLTTVSNDEGGSDQGRAGLCAPVRGQLHVRDRRRGAARTRDVRPRRHPPRPLRHSTSSPR